MSIFGGPLDRPSARENYSRCAWIAWKCAHDSPGPMEWRLGSSCTTPRAALRYIAVRAAAIFREHDLPRYCAWLRSAEAASA